MSALSLHIESTDSMIVGNCGIEEIVIVTNIVSCRLPIAAFSNRPYLSNIKLLVHSSYRNVECFENIQGLQ